MRLQVGELAVYPAHGVGTIEAIEEKLLSGQTYVFYVMRILDNGMKIMIPAHNIDNIGLRPVIKIKDVESIYSLFESQTATVESGNWNKRQREYFDKLKTGSAFDVAEVLCDLMCMRALKGLSFGERKLLDTAKSLLIKEISVVTGKNTIDIDNEINAFFLKPGMENLEG